LRSCSAGAGGTRISYPRPAAGMEWTTPWGAPARAAQGERTAAEATSAAASRKRHLGCVAFTAGYLMPTPPPTPRPARPRRMALHRPAVVDDWLEGCGRPVGVPDDEKTIRRQDQETSAPCWPKKFQKNLVR
jgi:hypothetical protein